MENNNNHLKNQANDYKGIIVAKRLKAEAPIKCGICNSEAEFMKTIKCGHTFCKTCIYKRAREYETCPVCNAEIRFLQGSCLVPCGESGSYMRNTVRNFLNIIMGFVWDRERNNLPIKLSCCDEPVIPMSYIIFYGDNPDLTTMLFCHLTKVCARKFLFSLANNSVIRQIVFILDVHTDLLCPQNYVNVITDSPVLVLQDINDRILALNKLKSGAKN